MALSCLDVQPCPPVALKIESGSCAPGPLYEKEPQWGVTVLELQMAIQEHRLRIANLSAGAIAAGKPLITERRQT